VVGEPVWTGSSDAQVREWKRFESLVNVAYARFPALALCPYDAHALSPSILADAYCTHPELLAGSRAEESPAFVDTEAFMHELDRQGLGEPEAAWEELAFHGDLGELRRFVVAQTSRAGVAGTKLAELRWAANEIATNVLRHGGGEARVRTWSTPGEFVCEVADRGPGIEDPLVGRLPPDPSQALAPGLWLVHQLCDLVELHSASGLTVRLHVMPDRREFNSAQASIASRFSA
jgi:anti-sigma regulatory factor (Ser/Thr protein kinase)